MQKSRRRPSPKKSIRRKHPTQSSRSPKRIYTKYTKSPVKKSLLRRYSRDIAKGAGAVALLSIGRYKWKSINDGLGDLIYKERLNKSIENPLQPDMSLKEEKDTLTKFEEIKEKALDIRNNHEQIFSDPFFSEERKAPSNNVAIEEMIRSMKIRDNKKNIIN